jgi:dTDP-4-amino-4,6-dideoxygalactose transaminase
MKIFESSFTKEELSFLDPILQKGELGFGPNVSLFETQFQPFSNKTHNIATNSASAAAFMVFAYLKEKYGVCDIYTPSLAFTSPAWAAKHFGHNIVWVDIDNNLLFDINDYYNKRKLRCERYSDRGITPVLMPILYGGVSNIPGFDNIEGGYNEIIVVDSAHCVTPTIKSDFIFFSFHPYKPICSSDGGMISTDDQEAAEWLGKYRNFGRQNVDNSYDIIQNGFKFYMNNLNASIALISLGKYFSDLKTRKENYSKLDNVLPHDEKSSYYIATRIDKNANQFNQDNNLARHYPLLHKTSYFNSDIRLPNTELLHSQIINLPLWKLL